MLCRIEPGNDSIVFLDCVMKTGEHSMIGWEYEIIESNFKGNIYFWFFKAPIDVTQFIGKVYQPLGQGWQHPGCYFGIENGVYDDENCQFC